ncbi:HyaD/HybD family hydrogenase maturation endopeptidase [Geobacter sp. AOG1]|uniref:HyaD/HybD family hydrogenase maturation endopeptidase n=1 Tax=Geobacter sp. AOG1 TaxID=1566346 RepID=UPI001CC640FF|nr:HyaD/HybD family hydrogenase maturation endopeptidase [Geobacter sp. AOG1]GFE57463.1 membrane protein [Geobacter sp. AOG1]
MSTLVLGIGNLIMTDDGVGVRVVQRLQREYRFPPEVKILDGGTLGLDLLPWLEGVGQLLMVDAVETGWEPGTVVRLVGEELPIALKTKLSPHQMGLQDLLAVAELQGFSPREMVLWGVQPAVLEMGMELSLPVAAQLDELVERVLAELAAWGVGGQPIVG